MNPLTWMFDLHFSSKTIERSFPFFVVIFSIKRSVPTRAALEPTASALWSGLSGLCGGRASSACPAISCGSRDTDLFSVTSRELLCGTPLGVFFNGRGRGKESFGFVFGALAFLLFFAFIFSFLGFFFSFVTDTFILLYFLCLVYPLRHPHIELYLLYFFL